jgi:glycosyltransferase involved in cell wall biosynthesis
VDVSSPRLLHVCAIAGTARHLLLPQMVAAKDAGLEVSVACSPGADLEAVRAAGIRTIELPIARSYSVPAHARSVARIATLLRRERPDILHVHTPVASLLARLGAVVARVPGVVYTAHGFYFHERLPTLERAAHIALERAAARFTDVLLTQSEEDRRTCLEVGIRPRRLLATLGNGVDVEAIAAFAPERAAVRAELGIAPDDLVVGFVGRRVLEKGWPDLAEAVRLALPRIPRLRALTIGGNVDGDRDRTGTIELPRAIVLGQRTDVPRLLHAVDVFALPSYREGMPRSILEAMAAEKPVVATNIRGCREEVVDGVTGHLVPVGSPRELAAALERVLTSADRRARMGAAGLERARALFDERLVIERLFAAYALLLRP